MKKLVLLVLLLGVVSTPALADQIVSNCTSPTADVNPVLSGSLVSFCGPGFQPGVDSNGVSVLPPGATLTSIQLLSRYSLSLELGGMSGTADFRHVTDITGLLGINSFDNTVFDSVISPLLDQQWGSGPDISGGSFSCAGINQAACVAIVNLLNSGVVTIKADFQNAGGQASGVSVDFAWVVNFAPVPEPASLLLIGIGVLALEIGRRAKRR